MGDANLSEAEIEARVTVYEPGIVLVCELPNATSETFLVLNKQIVKLGAEQRRWGLIIDLSDVLERPSAAHRAAINQQMRTYTAVHVAFVQPGNFLVRATLRFIIGNASGKTTVHKERNEAIEAVRASLA